MFRLRSILRPLIILCFAGSLSAQEPITFSSAEVQQLEAFGPWPTTMRADPGNEYSGVAWAEKLGEVLFNDPGLSAAGDISCATCHQADRGFSDGISVAKGAAAHVRNTQTLFDVGLQRWFGWDGGADSLWAAAIRPMLADIEMNNTPLGIADYARSLPLSTWPKSEAERIASLDDQQLAVFVAKLIASYTRTIVSVPTGFDRFRQALVSNKPTTEIGYSIAAQRGLKIFMGEANCWVCHFGPNFSNGEFHDTGRPFFTGVGQVDPGRYTGVQRVRSDPYNLLGEYASSKSTDSQIKTSTVKLTQSNWGQWRTPGLRQLSLTAPYMHDGSIATLRAVVDAYADIDPDRIHASGESLIKPLSLDEQARNDLVEFLLSLSQP